MILKPDEIAEGEVKANTTQPYTVKRIKDEEMNMIAALVSCLKAGTITEGDFFDTLKSILYH